MERHKIIDSKEVLNCPSCNSNQIKDNFLDWNGLNYSICNDCGCHYQNPRVFIQYEEDYWGEVVDPDGNKRILGNERESKIRNWYGNTINYINNSKPGKILDIGSGLGYFLSAINDNWVKYAQDYSTFSLKYIKDNYPDINISNDDVYNLSFEDGFFDAMMFYHVIEHLDSPSEALAEINRILKTGGTLMIGTPNIKSIAARIFKGRFRHYGPPHINLFTPMSLEKLLVNNGFSIIKREYPFFGTDYATIGNFFRMLYPTGVSPAFYGSVMTYYCKKI